MDLLALSDFHLVAAHWVCGRASRASGQSKATLSRQVREFEGSLGVRLLFAQTSLGGLAAAFLAAFPRVLLEVATDDRFVDLVADEIDVVVVRVNPCPDSDRVGRCFLRNRQALFAPPDLPRPVPDASSGQPAAFPAVMRTGMLHDESWRILDEDSGQETLFHPKPVLRLVSPLSMPDARCPMPDARCPMPDARCRFHRDRDG